MRCSISIVFALCCFVFGKFVNGNKLRRDPPIDERILQQLRDYLSRDAFDDALNTERDLNNRLRSYGKNFVNSRDDSDEIRNEERALDSHNDERRVDKRPVIQSGHPADTDHIYIEQQNGRLASNEDLFFVALVAGCSAAAVFGIIATGFCWYRLQRNAKAAADAEYPAYGVTGPNKELSPTAVDRKLVQSAHMYHYQHQKQQMIALEKSAGGERNIGSTSDVDSDDENEEGDYTVYECPGLAPTGEMEVKNPLFQDEPTPASPQILAPAKPTDSAAQEKR